jgi:hypothetical protein
MPDYLNTVSQSRRFFREYFRPDSQRVTHRLHSINELGKLSDRYDLFILDRDGTLHEYHSKGRVPEFEDTIKLIGPKSELVSNSSYEEMLRIRDVFKNDMPISKLVKFEESIYPHLLRFENGKLNVYQFDAEHDKVTEAKYINTEDKLHYHIVSTFKKPDPLVIKAVIAVNRTKGRIDNNSKVLMVGDRYLTDIVCGNLAGTDTALVDAYKPFSDPLALIFARYALDYPIGKIMNLFSSRDSKTF